MFIAIIGTRSSGRSTLESYLVELKGFTPVRLEPESPASDTPASDTDLYRCNPLSFSTPTELLDHVTRNWRTDFVTVDLVSKDVLESFAKRPFFVVINVDAPLHIRFERAARSLDKALSLEDFVRDHDEQYYGTAPSASQPTWSLIDLHGLVHLHVVNSFETISAFYTYLDGLDLLDGERLRPGWDAYFMQLASLASRRSNCMKRRVGAILVRNERILATGYNGTPRGLANCNEGGCDRCNCANETSHECICLHAEENALLEAGRERIGDGAVLYCNTCPCLKCTVKIIQTGIKEVVYNLSYKVDDASTALFEQAGVLLRRHAMPD
ncbi:uncharacterized protein LAESUDRAFT_737177 [Laetiporus sulphureus 93-53]|uniref:Deoxycytidylate deaminase n=1 Tax=Laetiporus sulphureus 93-53 TaxID=1314785 RepID=A0A165DXU1_9APHY|nr:uncharacterized protein LAESUDRAFT_737177 [Laetiporus sulphureus 93-53]KZT05841.1 hypothetical protein LAESUDRAFT_737177 [Laetiporus sulphureus 93-53]